MPPRTTSSSSKKSSQSTKRAKTKGATAPSTTVASARAAAPAGLGGPSLEEQLVQRLQSNLSALLEALTDARDEYFHQMHTFRRMEVLREDRESAVEVARATGRDVRHRRSPGLICGYESWVSNEDSDYSVEEDSDVEGRDNTESNWDRRERKNKEKADKSKKRGKDVRHRASPCLICGYDSWMSQDDSDYSVPEDSDVESWDKTEKSWARDDRKKKEKADNYAFIPNELPALQEKIKVITAKLDAKKRKIKKQYKIMDETKEKRHRLDEEIDDLTYRHAGYWGKYKCHFDDDGSDGSDGSDDGW
ncbi:hypothetical protein IAT38_006005 [Cryptococcus sp. DSM 104549]